MSECAPSHRRHLKERSLRQRIRTSPVYRRVKLFLKRLGGREPWIRRDLHVPLAVTDDFHYDPSSLDAGSIVYSCGIGRSVDFELQLVESHGFVVHAFDPTPSTAEWIDQFGLPEQIEFHPWAVAGEDGELKMYPRLRRDGRPSDVMWTTDLRQAATEPATSFRAYTIASLMEKLGHDRIDLLKIDIEGAEYDVLAEMLRSHALPAQILVEFHHRFAGIGKQKTLDCLDRLRSAGYQVVWISRTGREVSLIHRA